MEGGGISLKTQIKRDPYDWQSNNKLGNKNYVRIRFFPHCFAVSIDLLRGFKYSKNCRDFLFCNFRRGPRAFQIEKSSVVNP